jgi:RNA polymerase sigma-70 factor, ECF subfamily
MGVRVDLNSMKNKTDFEKLVKANMQRAYFTALGIFGSHDAAMEISQEAFIKVYKNFYKYDRKKNFFTWYYKILKNLCLNFIRDKERLKEEKFLKWKTYTAEDVYESFEQKELNEKLEEALHQITVEDKEIITLKEFEDLSYNEIAQILEIPAGTVMSRLFYARKRLAEKLKGKL